MGLWLATVQYWIAKGTVDAFVVHLCSQTRLNTLLSAVNHLSPHGGIFLHTSGYGIRTRVLKLTQRTDLFSR